MQDYLSISNNLTITVIRRFSYKGKVAKHRIEVKKAVFVETSSQVTLNTFGTKIDVTFCGIHPHKTITLFIENP